MTVEIISKNNRFLQYFTTIAATFCMLISGMHFGWSSPSLPKLLSNDSTIPINNSQASWIASMSLLGDLVGAPMSATLADTFGRKSTILFAAIPYTISWILIAVAENVTFLLIARFICGIGDGISFTIAPMFIGEIADDDIRGLLGSFVCTMCDVGILIIYAFGPYFSIKQSAVISLIFPVLLFIMFIPMPESPYYLVMKKKDNKAKKSLQRLRGRTNVDDELIMIKKSVREQMSNPGTFKEIFHVKSNRNALLILVGLKGAQQLSGISAFLFYVEIIFHQNKSNFFKPEISSMLFAFLQILTSLSSSLFIDKLGRKPLLIISLMGCAIPLTLQGAFFYFQCSSESLNWLPLMNMLIFIVAYSIGLGIVPYMMPGELFPTNIKAKALGLMDIYLALAAFFVTKVYQIIADEFGTHVPFFIFTVCCLANICFVILYVPETKGKSLDEIQYWLKFNQYEEPVKDNNSTNQDILSTSV